MTDELTKTFFDTFGIEPKEFKSCDVGTFCPYPEKECGTDTCPYYRTYKVDYPAITDHILLELILINMHYEDLFGHPTNTQELKDNTLKQLIETYNKFSTCVTYDGEYQQTARKIKHQISILFEEE